MLPEPPTYTKKNGLNYEFRRAIPAGVADNSAIHLTNVALSENRLILGAPWDGTAGPRVGLARIVTLPCLLNEFSRGDADANGVVDMDDLLKLLEFTFVDSSLVECEDALDIDDSGHIDLSDSVRLLAYLFTGGQPPSAPFQSCGVDATEDDLSCSSFVNCP